MNPVVGREEESAVHVGQRSRVSAGTAGVDFADLHGAGGGTVALPQLAVREEQHAVHVREQVATNAALDQHGAGGGAVRLPQTRVCVVTGHEKQRAVDV